MRLDEVILILCIENNKGIAPCLLTVKIQAFLAEIDRGAIFLFLKSYKHVDIELRSLHFIFYDLLYVDNHLYMRKSCCE